MDSIGDAKGLAVVAVLLVALTVLIAAPPASGQSPGDDDVGSLVAQLLPRRPAPGEERPGEEAPRPTTPPRSLSPETEPGDALVPEPDRWRLLLPGATVRPRTPLYDPYNPNILKGDYPILGDRLFFTVTGVLDTFLDQKRNLDFTERSPDVPFHEDNSLTQITASIALELFHGTTVFAPKDWAIRVTPLYRFRCNDNNAQDYQCGTHFTLFEAFAEAKLFEIGDTFDPTSARLGIQVFNADFFGFVYNDTQPGFRLFSEIARNQYKGNLAVFDRLNKDFLTALNELYDRREHQVAVLSLQWDDFLWPGFNILPNVVYSHDDFVPGGALDAVWVGFAANGHVGPFNVNGAAYYVFGDTAKNTPSGRSQDISAGMVFAQVTYPISFLNPRLAVLYATGDHDPNDDDATGFDSAFDTVNFGGGQFSFLFGEKVPFGAAGAQLFRGNSVFPSLRAANATSQFVNPGVLVVNPGIDIQLTAITIFEANYNYVRFDNTSSLERIAGKSVAAEAGHEFNAGLTYRPFANEQVILFGGGAVFLPSQGIEDFFGTSKAAYKALLRLVLTF
jgi:hypothetical protein